jgi:hypothetical protein
MNHYLIVDNEGNFVMLIDSNPIGALNQAVAFWNIGYDKIVSIQLIGKN